MKTVKFALPLQNELADLVPNLAFRFKWSLDTEAEWDVVGDLDKDDYQAWQVDVSANVTAFGDLVSRHSYLCGSWYEIGHHPSQVDPNIGGYAPQLMLDALEQLKATGTPGVDFDLAISWIRLHLTKSYDEQRAQITQPTRS
jgi:hypothetical protein